MYISSSSRSGSLSTVAAPEDGGSGGERRRFTGNAEERRGGTATAAGRLGSLLRGKDDVFAHADEEKDNVFTDDCVLFTVLGLHEKPDDRIKKYEEKWVSRETV